MRLEEIQPFDEIEERQRYDAGDEDGVAHGIKRLIVYVCPNPVDKKQKAVADRLPLSTSPESFALVAPAGYRRTLTSVA